MNNDYSQLFQPMQSPQQQQAQTQTSSYPSLPNAYGLGTQQSMQQPQVPTMQSAPIDAYAQQKQQAQQQMTADTSRGFNPWSALGESNAR